MIAAEERALPNSFLAAGVCLSSDAQISENPHLGYRLSTAVLHQGFAPVISNTVTAFGALGYDFRVGPCYTGKERDSETGLDFFGARYMSSAQGRFTSPDPEEASASLFDPQLWNAYSYGNNNPQKYVDKDGRFPLLAITAGVGAAVGGIVGGGVEAFSQYSRTGHIDSWGKIGTATLGGAVAGGVAGFTLGIGSAAGVAVTTTEVVIANGASSVLGGIVQRSTNEALGLDQPGGGTEELLNVGLDGVTGGVGGYIGGVAADRLYPLPNIRKEIQLLQNASRRSTRPAKMAAFKEQVKRQAFFNACAGGVIGGLRSEGIKFFWNWFANPEPVHAAAKKDYAVDINVTYQ